LITDNLKEGSLLSFLAKDPEKADKAFLSLENFLQIQPSSEANQKFWMCPFSLWDSEKARLSLNEGSASDQESAQIL
jgi:hypothetical protein